MKKLALVTGSSRGIGKAIALKLAKDGFDIIVHYKSNKTSAEEVRTLVEDLGVTAYVYQCDLSRVNEIKDMFKSITADIGRLDLLVNNAGFDYAKMIEDFELEEMRHVIDVILFARIATTKLALPLLKKSEYPNIINIASRMGKEKTIPTIGAYGPAEAGVIKWTQCCALEFAKYRIRVNCVAPGLTDTDMTREILTESEFKAAAEANPRGRVGQSEDIANTVAFIASKDSEYINGETIGVNGGSNLG